VSLIGITAILCSEAIKDCGLDWLSGLNECSEEYFGMRSDPKTFRNLFGRVSVLTGELDCFDVDADDVLTDVVDADTTGDIVADRHVAVTFQSGRDGRR